MTDHTFYIVASYGVFALALVLELALLSRRRRRALRDRTLAEGDLP